MKGRLPLFVLLGSSLAFLASLFLNWASAAPPVERTGSLSIIDLAGQFSVNGWASPFGEAAAIAAVALALCALVSLRRAELEAALPIGGCAIALATLALVSAAGDRAFNTKVGSVPVHVGAGTYLGGAAALVALVTAAWVSHDEVSEIGSAVLAMLFTVGLVTAYVVLALTGQEILLFVGSYSEAVMLLIASFGVTFWWGAKRPLRRLASAAMTLVLVVGGFARGPLGTEYQWWPFEVWLAIGCAIGLLVLAIRSSWRDARLVFRRADAIALAGSALLLASLFFGWVKACGGDFCNVYNGWSVGPIGGLAGIFVVILLGFRYFAPELAVAVAVYVLGEGLASTAGGSLEFGAYLGFAGTALLVLALGMQRRKNVRLGWRLVPVVTCVALLALPAANLTGRMPIRIELNDPWPLNLLRAAAIVVGLRLIGRWLIGPGTDGELVLLPLALLALVGLDLGRDQQIHLISWEGWLALLLSLVLLVLGSLNRYRGGLDRWRIPDEIWRIDQISTGEN